MPIDCMHCILLGVVKQLLEFWFDSTNYREKFYVGRRIAKVDENIQKVKLTQAFTRKPRTILDRKFWKANEYRSWLLYYGVHCLINMFPIVYLNHFSLLSNGVWL